jgi:Zn-dependent protease
VTTVEIINIVTIILALMVAIIGHEIMHGRVAYYYGDNTAASMNRLSINPIVHIDPIGTILVPALLYFSNVGFLFGWAKPVPVNMRTVISNGGYNGAIGVALAGIAYNITLAIVASIALKAMPSPTDYITLFISNFLLYTVIYNIVLALFNLLPIPPLDGSQALGYLFRKLNMHTPANFMDSIGQYGMIILILIIATPLSNIVFAPMQKIIEAVINL